MQAAPVAHNLAEVTGLSRCVAGAVLPDSCTRGAVAGCGQQEPCLHGCCKHLFHTASLSSSIHTFVWQAVVPHYVTSHAGLAVPEVVYSRHQQPQLSTHAVPTVFVSKILAQSVSEAKLSGTPRL